jgi:hypothetical protein
MIIIFDASLNTLPNKLNTESKLYINANDIPITTIHLSKLND